MKCPYCEYLESKVIDTRPVDDGSSIRRRRECLKCEKRFTTYEQIESVPLVVIKKDGKRQVYNRQKMMNGILRACEKTPVSFTEIEKAVLEIETTLNPTETCGEKDIYFHINTADLGGADLVIFESLYEDDELILEHRDFNNYDETVSVAPPAPDTGFMTRLISDGGNTKIVFIIAGGIVFLGVGGYFTSRHFAKKKFMKKF